MDQKRKSLLFDIGAIIAGCALIALGLSAFTIPNRIAPGGLSGIATAISYLTGLSVGTLALILNVPLFLIAWRRLGFKPLVKTLIATVLLSVLIDLFRLVLPQYTKNVLFAALLGGVCIGAGMGVLLARGISTGGTDLISLLVHRGKPIFSMGQLLIAIDTAVVLLAVIVFRDIEVALYSVFTLVIASKTVDAIQQGVDHAKVIYIVTECADALTKRLAQEMGRGITVLPAHGGFTGKEKAMLMTIARRSEVHDTLLVVREIDPSAFTILSDATAVYGEGFKD